MVDDDQTSSNNTVQADSNVSAKNTSAEQPLLVKNPINADPVLSTVPYASPINLNTNPQLVNNGSSSNKIRWSKVLLNAAIFLVIPITALLIGTLINPHGLLSYDFTDKDAGILGFIMYLPSVIYLAVTFASVVLLSYIFSGSFFQIFTHPNTFMIITTMAPVVAISSIVYIVRLKPKKSFLILEVIWSIILLLMTASAPASSEGSEG